MPRLLLAWLALPLVAAAVDVTQCEQAIGPQEIGELRADLSCNPLEIGVHLAAGGTLRLNGFTIAGQGQDLGTGVECSGAQGGGAWSTIEGPGEIRNLGVAVAGGGGRLRIHDVTLRGNGFGLTYKAPRIIELVNVVAIENDVGLSSRGGRLRGRDVEASRNTTAGVWSGSATTLVRLTAIGNGARGGVYGRVERLVDSHVSGNDGLGLGYDVLVTGRARLVRTTCGQAARIRVAPDHTTTVTRQLRCSP